MPQAYLRRTANLERIKFYRGSIMNDAPSEETLPGEMETTSSLPPFDVGSPKEKGQQPPPDTAWAAIKGLPLKYVFGMALSGEFLLKGLTSFLDHYSSDVSQFGAVTAFFSGERQILIGFSTGMPLSSVFFSGLSLLSLGYSVKKYHDIKKTLLAFDGQPSEEPSKTLPVSGSIFPPKKEEVSSSWNKAKSFLKAQGMDALVSTATLENLLSSKASLYVYDTLKTADTSLSPAVSAASSHVPDFAALLIAQSLLLLLSTVAFGINTVEFKREMRKIERPQKTKAESPASKDDCTPV